MTDSSGLSDDVPPALPEANVPPTPAALDPLSAPLEQLVQAAAEPAEEPAPYTPPPLPEVEPPVELVAPTDLPAAEAAPVEPLVAEPTADPVESEQPSAVEPEPSLVAPAEVPPARVPPKHHRSFLRELPVLVIIAFVLALLIKHFLVQAFYIPSGSMQQTLQIGDRVIVNKVPYLYRGPHRGEIVVFNGLDSFDDGVRFQQPTNPIAKALRTVSGAVGLGAPNEKDYIKRVIGVAGDRVMCCDTNGQVVVTPKGGNPTSLTEPYIYENDATSNRYFCQAVADGKPASKDACPPGAEGILVPSGRLWVMGDHRGNSSDSRFHISDAHQGTVPEDKVVGRAFAVVYPFSRFGLLHVPAGFAHVALPAAPYALGLLGALPLTLRRRRRRRH